MDEARPAEIDRWVMVLLVRERGDAGRERAARGIRGQREGRVKLIRKGAPGRDRGVGDFRGR